MKTLISTVLLVTAVSMTTGCTAGFNAVANYYDKQDPCLQAAINHTTMPSFCGASDRTWVKTYYRKDGTRVRGHYRSYN